MRKLLLGFGLLPVWIWLGFGAYALTQDPADKVLQLMMFLLLAVIPAAAVTLVIAALAASARVMVKGERSKRWVTTLVLLILCGALAAYYVVYRNRSAEMARQIEAEEARVVAFVSNHPQVLAPAGGHVRSWIWSKTGPTGRMPSAYRVSAKNDDARLTVIVVPDRRTAAPTFQITCLSVDSPHAVSTGPAVCELP